MPTSPAMTLAPSTEPITASDAEIRAHTDDAQVAALLAAVAQVTGDLDLLRPDLCPDPSNVLDPDGGLTAEQIAEARDLAAAALARWRDAGCVPAPRPAPADLRRLLAYVVGDDALDEWHDVLLEELALGGDDLRAPQWHTHDVAPDTDFTVAIVGAGMSGILAAHRLGQAGVPYVVLEKNPDVGGTWFDNTYPGCRVDVPNHLYSYSCAPAAWQQNFSPQAELLDYFRNCADAWGVRDQVRFGTEVLGAEWSDDTGTWRVRVRDVATGAEHALEVQALVSAVGQLNRPSYPRIDGLGSFAGPAFHSAEWDHSVDLRGRRVAVIGTGASAVQFVPHVAEAAASTVVFQRTPNWFLPADNYHDDLADGVQWLIRSVPGFAQWYRLFLFWRMHEGLLPAARVDPEWVSETGSVSMMNELIREFLLAKLRTDFADDPEMLDRVTPRYPPIAKRALLDNGSWAATLLRDDVELCTDAIARITPRGVETVDGTLHEVDVIIYGTGFTASDFLVPMQLVGRRGVELHERWGGDARAYLGITVPDFPNLFLLYGPNTNIVINGSIIYFSECEVRYLVESVRLLLEGPHQAMAVRPEVHDEFGRAVDAENERMVWGAADVNSWYKNASGRVAQNWPFTLIDYWRRTLRPDPADYELT